MSIPGYQGQQFCQALHGNSSLFNLTRLLFTHIQYKCITSFPSVQEARPKGRGRRTVARPAGRPAGWPLRGKTFASSVRADASAARGPFRRWASVRIDLASTPLHNGVSGQKSFSESAGYANSPKGWLFCRNHRAGDREGRPYVVQRDAGLGRAAKEVDRFCGALFRPYGTENTGNTQSIPGVFHIVWTKNCSRKAASHRKKRDFYVGRGEKRRNAGSVFRAFSTKYGVKRSFLRLLHPFAARPLIAGPGSPGPYGDDEGFSGSVCSARSAEQCSASHRPSR